MRVRALTVPLSLAPRSFSDEKGVSVYHRLIKEERNAGCCKEERGSMEKLAMPE